MAARRDWTRETLAAGGRCPVCGEVQIVLIEARGLVCVDAQGLAALSIGE